MGVRVHIGILSVVAVLGMSRNGVADVPLAERMTWSGPGDYFATGAPMASDGSDADTTMVDQLAQPTTVTVSPLDVPSTAKLVQALLYWGGSIDDNGCAAAANIDDRVDFTPPGGVAAEVIANTCYCSDAGALAYDIQICRADVTPVIAAATTTLAGDYAVNGFAAHITNASTDNASMSLVLVYSDPALPPRRIALYDGLFTMADAVNASAQFTLGGLDVGTPARGVLTWYTLEGDGGGTGVEQVTVSGSPGNASLVVTDAVNPTSNPMNHTINTVSPARIDSLGVDIDRFDISSALTPGDTAVEMRYEAGADKWWIAYNIVGITVFEPVIASASTKSVELQVDADANGEINPGDSVRYTIRLENTGTAAAIVDVSDAIPAEAASWILVDAGGGTDVSTATLLSIENIPVAVGGSASVVLDVVIADVPDNTTMSNTAMFDASPDGGTGILVAPPVLIRSPSPVCGDSQINDVGEACDEGTVDTATCNAIDCQIPSCGDGHINLAAGEDCEGDSLCDSVTCTYEFTLGGGCRGCAANGTGDLVCVVAVFALVIRRRRSI